MAGTQPRGLPGGAQWLGYTAPEEIAKNMLAERKMLNAKMKLTWNPSAPPLTPLDRIVGEVNLSLPYIRVGSEQPGRHYFIQNANLYLSNGSPTTLDEIGQIEGEGSFTYVYVTRALESFLEEAITKDPSLCKMCRSFRAPSPDDYMQHMFSEHPAQAMKVVGLVETGRPEPEADATEAFECECGKSFDKKQGLVAHKRFGHKRA